jgi:large subunit ribosomal protein L23
MADITDIKSIIYTEKALGNDDSNANIVVIKTGLRMTKNNIKEIFREYFGVKVEKVNSLRQQGKVKRFRGITGSRSSYKKFYVWLPEGAQIESLMA